jgi:diguanylate cyclase (GGDEF)-like protein
MAIMTITVIAHLVCLLGIVLASGILAFFVRQLLKRIAELERARVQAQTEADTDHLTGVWSRRGGERRLNEALRQVPCAVAYIDLDKFGRLNKEHGQAAGDKQLVEFTKFLAARFRRSCDTVYREGGDEFVVVMPALVRYPDALSLASQEPQPDPLHLAELYLQRNLEEITHQSGIPFTFGVITTRQYPIGKVLNQAKEEMRAAKRRKQFLIGAMEEM